MNSQTKTSSADPYAASARHPALRQILVVVAAAIVVGLLIGAIALAGARLIPGERDCVLTDNAGCVSAASPGLAGAALTGNGFLSKAELAEGLALLDDPSFVDMPLATVSDWGRRPPSEAEQET
jgi:hypothetical protein